MIAGRSRNERRRGQPRRSFAFFGLPFADFPALPGFRPLPALLSLRCILPFGYPPAFFGFPYEWTEEQAEAALEAAFVEAPPPPDIFLSHTPPARLANRSVGARDNRTELV